MEAAGIEPAGDFAATGKLPCGCVICEECRAANALHGDCSSCLCMASLDADLQQIVETWSSLPGPIRAAILTLAKLQEF